jgi:hypothetical protein
MIKKIAFLFLFFFFSMFRRFQFFDKEPVKEEGEDSISVLFSSLTTIFCFIIFVSLSQKIAPTCAASGRGYIILGGILIVWRGDF